jgi:hypothetical protein
VSIMIATSCAAQVGHYGGQVRVAVSGLPCGRQPRFLWVRLDRGFALAVACLPSTVVRTRIRVTAADPGCTSP